MLLLFRCTITVVLPIIFLIFFVIGCLKKKPSQSKKKPSKVSTVTSTTISQEKTNSKRGSKDAVVDVSKPGKLPTLGENNKNLSDKKSKQRSLKAQKQDGLKMEKKASDKRKKKANKKSPRTQETQEVVIKNSKNTDDSCMHTAIRANTMMHTVREPSKIASNVGNFN